MLVEKLGALRQPAQPRRPIVALLVLGTPSALTTPTPSRLFHNVNQNSPKTAGEISLISTVVDLRLGTHGSEAAHELPKKGR